MFSIYYFTYNFDITIYYLLYKLIYINDIYEDR